MRHVPHLYNTHSKHRILFDKGEACASTPRTSLRKTLDISNKIRHVFHPKKPNSKHRNLFDKGEACA